MNLLLPRPSNAAALPLLLAVLILGSILLKPLHVINHDVAFLLWTADQVLGPPAYGSDIYDVNPPLSFLIYSPAVLLAKWIGFDWGLRVWMLALSCLSLVSFWQTADGKLRAPLSVAFVLFLLLAFPDHFAQREQIAFLLCLPYVAGHNLSKGGAVVNGVMAGVGFALKPYFLIPLLLVFALRRKVRIEEVCIAATGLVYAAVLIIFFQAYLFEMVPAASQTYWAIRFPLLLAVLQSVLIILMAGSVFLAGEPQAEARTYLAAATGFAIAALLQRKGFFYHYIPAWGFLALFLTACLFNGRRVAARAAAAFLLIEAVQLGRMAAEWIYTYGKERDDRIALQQEIDRSTSVVSLVPHPYPAFPLVLFSPARFEGMAICQIFIPAVAAYVTGTAQGDPSVANRLALMQVKRELARKPDLVIANAVIYKTHDDTFFNVLEWYQRDEEFRRLWSPYEHTATIGKYALYRRK